MYRVVFSENYHALTKDYNALIKENPDHNCKILSITTLPTTWLCSIFTLSPVVPETAPQKVGEYKVVFFRPEAEGSPDLKRYNKAGNFGRELNAVNESEGWVLALIWTHYPVAIFYRNVEYSASALGFASEDGFRAFKRSGCETREQYESYLKLIAGYTTKLDEIHQDAGEALKLGRSGEYIRLAFLELEQLIIALYSVLRHSDKPEKDTPPTHLLEGMCRVYQVQLVDPKGYARWRGVRNRVVHENEKIDAKTTKAAGAFFTETAGKLKKLLQEMPYDLEWRVNHEGFDDNLRARVDLAGLAPLAGHEGEIEELGDEDRDDSGDDLLDDDD